MRKRLSRKILKFALAPAAVSAAYVGSRYACEHTQESPLGIRILESRYNLAHIPTYYRGEIIRKPLGGVCMPSTDGKGIACSGSPTSPGSDIAFAAIVAVGTVAVFEALEAGRYYHDKRQIETVIRNRIKKRYPNVSEDTIKLAVADSYPLYKKLAEKRISLEKVKALKSEYLTKKKQGKKVRFLRQKLFLATHPIPDKPYWHTFSGHVL